MISQVCHHVKRFPAGPLLLGIVLGGAVLGVLLKGVPEWSPPVSIAQELPRTISTDDASSEGFRLFNESLVRVADMTRPSVVNISSTVKLEMQEKRLPFPFFDDPFFRRFFGEEFRERFPSPPEFRQEGTGSGVIMSSDGYIITNTHVVEGADEIQVLLADMRKFKANLVGTDPKTDLAVIKIDAAELPALKWGDSNQLRVGEVVVAVGNPFGLNQTVTMGIISAVGRANVGIVDYEDFIQTDAAINPGNSGGALVNMKGELIGINTAIFTRTGGYMGIGFAIPSRMAKVVAKNLIDHGKVIRGWLGISIQELTPELADQFDVHDTKGVLVSDVVRDGPAYQANLKRGDIIRRYDGHTVTNPVRLRTLVADTSPGTSVNITILRDGKERTVTVTVGEQPRDFAADRGTGGVEGDHALSGVLVGPAPPDETRQREEVIVHDVASGSPAAKAGLRRDDIILEINRRTVRDVDDFEKVIRTLGPRDTVLLLLRRGTGIFFLSVTP